MSRTSLIARAGCFAALSAWLAAAAGCAQKPQAPANPAPPVEVTGSAPFDLDAVMRQVRHAFRQDGPRFLAAEASYQVEVDALGFSFRTSGGARGVEFGRTQVRRGAGAAAIASEKVERDSDGSLIRSVEGIRERLRSHEGGVDQTWELAQRPAGSGPLSFRVPVPGLRLKAETELGLELEDPASEAGLRYGHATWIDARGERTALRARYERGEIALTVPEELLARSAYPAVLDPTISANIDTDQPVEGLLSRDWQGQPAVAFDGTNYLVVWTDRRFRRGFNKDVFGARVTPGGRVLDLEGFPIVVANGQEERPAIAYGNGQYLVVWEDYRNGGTPDLFGARVTPAGQVLDPNGFAVAVAPSYQYNAAVAFDGTNFLAVWSDQRVSTSSDIYGARITQAGTVLEPNGVALCTTFGYQEAPDVAFDGSSYLVAWADSRNSSQNDVYATRVSTAGAVLNGSGFLISGGTGGQSSPAVTAHPGGFFVVWEDGRSTAATQIYGARVTSAGALLDTAGIQISSGAVSAGYADVVFARSQFVAAWSVGWPADVYAARVGLDGVVIDTTAKAVSVKDDYQGGPVLAFDGHDVFMAYDDELNDGNSNVSGAWMDPDGNVRGDKPIAVSANDQQSPVVAYGAGRYLLAWTDNRYKPTGDADVWAVRIDETGTVLDPLGLQLSQGTQSETPFGAFFDGTNFVVALKMASGTPTRVGVVRVTPDGVLLDARPLPVASGATMAQQPGVAYGNGQLLFAWTDTRRNTTYVTDVFAARLNTATGAAPDGDGFEIVRDAADRSYSAQVASDGTDFLVTWADRRGGASTSDTFFARVTAGGAVLDDGGTALLATPSVSDPLPRMTFAGGNYLAAWVTGNNPGMTQVMRVAPDGTKLDAPAVIADAGALGNVVFDGTQYVAIGVGSANLSAVRVALDGGLVDVPPWTTPISPGWSGGASASDGNGKQLVTYTYTPGPYGSQFTYRLGSRFLVTRDNASPLADPQSLTTPEDTPLSITLSGTDGDSDPLSFLVGPGPSSGTLTGTPPNVTYTPNANFSGTDRFSFRVYDGTIPSAAATVTIGVVGANDAPVANSQTVAVRQGTPRSFALAGSDPDGNPLAFTILTQPAQGTLSGTAPNLVYTPGSAFTGADSFTWKVSDGTVDSAVATVTFAVAANQAPTADAQSVATDEDVAVPVVLAGSDPNGDALTYAVVSQPSNGTLSGFLPNLRYRPNANFTGGDSFTFKVSDGLLESPAATVSINVAAVNDLPVANPGTAQTVEDTPVAVTLTGTDPEGAPLTYTVVGPPYYGQLTGTPPNLTYVPPANYNGTVAFYFSVNDGVHDSTAAAVTITVTAVNDAPVAADIAKTSNEDYQLGISLAATDPDNSSLTYTIVTQPSNGTLTLSNGYATYRPSANWFGTDSFTYKASDGVLESNVATVTITVSSVNDVPVAGWTYPSTPEDTPVTFTLSATDADGDPLTYTVTSTPATGTLTGTPPDLTYTPPLNWYGSVQVNFTVTDGSATGQAYARITVYAVNDPPVANDVTATTAEDTLKTINFSATDVDGYPSYTYAIVSGPANGTLSGSGSYRNYLPNPDFTGTDSFTYRASDGSAYSAPATVTITVTPVEDAPRAVSQSVALDEDSSLAITLQGSDPEGASVNFTVVGQPTKGTLTGTGPNLVYTPNANYAGSDWFTFKVNDGALDSSNATVSITVRPLPDPPVAADCTATTPEDTATWITLPGSDPDANASLTYTIVTQPTNGSFWTAATGQQRYYTPRGNWSGTDTFTYKVSDGTSESNVATCTITVTPVNDYPIANGQSVTTPENTPKSITLTGSDPEGATVTFSVVSQPTKGTLSGTAPDLVYTPNANVSGTDSFTFQVSDGTLTRNATVTITITAVNDPPTVAPVSATTPEDAPVSITLLGSDPDIPTTLSYTIVTSPTKGTVTGTGATRTYTPQANFNGTDTFTYRASDGTATSNTETVTVTVTPVNDAPVAVSQNRAMSISGGPVTLSATDVDADVLTYAVLSAPDAGTLSGTAPSLSYAPPAGFTGTTSFTFKANDGTVDSNVATVTLNVTNVPPSLTAAADTLSPLEGQEVSFSATAADPEGATLTFGWTFGDGATADTPNPKHTYQEQGSFTATVTVSDGTQTSTANVALTVRNAAPSLVPSTEAVTGEEGTELPFSATVSDQGPLDVVVVSWAWADGSLKSIGASVTHAFPDDGTYVVTVTAADDDGASTLGSRTVTVTNVPPVPSQQAALSVVVGTEASAQLAATDKAGARDPLSWTLVEGPGAISASGDYRWTPAASDVGRHVVKARVSDDEAGSADSVFEVEVTAAPEPGGGGGGGGGAGAGGGDTGTATPGCGCGAGGGALSLLWVGALAALLRRRRGFAPRSARGG